MFSNDALVFPVGGGLAYLTFARSGQPVDLTHDAQASVPLSPQKIQDRRHQAHCADTRSLFQALAHAPSTTHSFGESSGRFVDSKWTAFPLLTDSLFGMPLVFQGLKKPSLRQPPRHPEIEAHFVTFQFLRLVCMMIM